MVYHILIIWVWVWEFPRIRGLKMTPHSRALVIRTPEEGTPQFMETAIQDGVTEPTPMDRDYEGPIRTARVGQALL